VIDPYQAHDRLGSISRRQLSEDVLDVDFTVPSVTKRRRAILLLVSPVAIHWSTSISREVNVFDHALTEASAPPGSVSAGSRLGNHWAHVDRRG
jgi:hypothetical protein